MALSPLALATNVPTTEAPTVTFSETMASATLTDLTFTLTQGATNIAGAVSLDVPTNTATFRPSSPLATNLPYTARITTAATSARGTGLAADHVWTFTTTPLELGAARTYSIFGASVTNTGSTTLGGDLGVSPGTSLVGFPPGTTSGATHAGDPQAAQARSDLVTAYTGATARASSGSLSGDLAGRTLTAGTYASSTALALTTTLTLDGQGNPDAVFLFQVTGALDTAAGSSVHLINGARASHVFWQASGAVTLGAASSFTGTVLGFGAITVGAGTVLEGRALTFNGLVTLAGDTVVMPSP